MIASRTSWRCGALLNSFRLEKCSKLLPSTSVVILPNQDVRQHSTVAVEQPSKRAAFKTTPVDPKLLNYIERIGVGIPKRTPRPRRRHSNKTRRKKDTLVLDGKQELEFFRQRSRNVQKERSRRPKATTTKSSGAPSWLPPPPFCATTTSQTDNETIPNNVGQKVKRHPVKVVASVGSPDETFPTNKGLPEVALAGRSNVGKSTLLNALLYGNQQLNTDNDLNNKQSRRKQGTKIPRGIKAVTSDRPGETRRITFYQLSSDIILENKDHDQKKIKMTLVDLPGYGFAFASEQKAMEWKRLLQNYLLHRGKSLKRVLLLIDARHGIKKADVDFLESLQSVLYLEGGGGGGGRSPAPRKNLPPIQLVLTKCDLVSQVDLAKRVVQAKQDLSDCLRREPSTLPVMLVSAKPGVGFNNVRGDTALGGVLELQREIASLAHFTKRPAQAQLKLSK